MCAANPRSSPTTSLGVHCGSSGERPPRVLETVKIVAESSLHLHTNWLPIVDVVSWYRLRVVMPGPTHHVMDTAKCQCGWCYCTRGHEL